MPKQQAPPPVVIHVHRGGTLVLDNPRIHMQGPPPKACGGYNPHPPLPPPTKNFHLSNSIKFFIRNAEACSAASSGRDPCPSRRDTRAGESAHPLAGAPTQGLRTDSLVEDLRGHEDH
ncbi:hypothetical protein PRIPAC_83286 [Pristionchus pacificus]|uniref:Uncharacterized protein n=1 Tax=Pristionchus pacificus TaxID=54126 RepID=A0A2A6BMT6_PRIPA|nr:hypothetical protein PRIPAC_83286 [Pristionchus pacificus]|eukprot:PDM67103.1 hypothetical protein PRIPAC_48520 [Pristionchus pacificus]